MNEIVAKYDLDKCVAWIKSHGLQRVCLQFPDGLLADSVQVALHLETCLESKVYILGDTSCGSCCVDEISANHINADGIIHFGHACLSPTARLPIFHVFEKKDIDVDSLCQAFSEFFPDTTTNVLLFYDVGYAHTIENVCERLNNKYTQLTLTKLSCVSNVEFASTSNSEKSSISGRSWDVENGRHVDEFVSLYIGDNDKTLGSLAFSVPAKNWCHYDRKNAKIAKFSVDENSWLKRRRYLIEKLRDASTVGIVVATLGIKDYLIALTAIKQALKSNNIKSYIFSVGKPNPAKLANFPEVDAFVVITCPENEIFESKEFYRPLLTPFEVEIAFNANRDLVANYCLDFRQLLPNGASYVEFASSAREADVSLLTGKLRNNATTSDDDDVQVDSKKTMKALCRKSDGAVIAIGKAGASFLNDRTWQGVEQKIGETDVEPAVKGRCGLPTGYANEPPIDRQSR